MDSEQNEARLSKGRLNGERNTACEGDGGTLKFQLNIGTRGSSYSAHIKNFAAFLDTNLDAHSHHSIPEEHHRGGTKGTGTGGEVAVVRTLWPAIACSEANGQI